MTPRELADKTVKDIIKRRLQSENEFYDYQRERNIRRRRMWSISVGGCRW